MSTAVTWVFAPKCTIGGDGVSSLLEVLAGGLGGPDGGLAAWVMGTWQGLLRDYSSSLLENGLAYPCHGGRAPRAPRAHRRHIQLVVGTEGT